MSDKILVTPRSITAHGHPALQKLRDAGFATVFCEPGRQPSEAGLITLLPDCVGYLAGVEKITAPVIGAARRLRVISRNGTGVENIDAAACAAKNIRICRAEGANARGVAELAMALMLALVRSIPFSDKTIKAGRWERRIGAELPGLTLGLIGCGKIGKIITRLATAFGMNVAAYDPFPDASFVVPGFRYADFESVIASADILSLHCPPSKDGCPVLDGATVGRMKKGAYLVNTARAGLLDEDAVLAALESGQITGLAVDVFAEEPPRDFRLLKHERVIATPHIGGFTRESVDRAVGVAVDNLLKALGE